MCKTQVDGTDGLEQHLKSEHGIDCAQCTFTCKDNNALTAHQTEKHAISHPCSNCLIDFSSEGELSGHLKTEHGIKCALCTFTCKDNDALAGHQIDQHSLCHACSICERDFINKTELKDHMEAEHYSDCNICGKLFKTSRDLQSHIEDCKLCSCEECNDIYYTVKDLNEHVMKKHKQMQHVPG